MPRISQHRTPHHPHRSAWPVGLAVAVVLGTLLSALSLGGQPLGGVSRVLGATVGGGTGTALTTPSIAPSTIQAHWSPTMPARSAQEQQAEARALALSRQHKAPPVGPIHHMTPAEAAALARTAGPPLPSPKSALAQAAPAGGPQADSDFDITYSSPTGVICVGCVSSAMGASVGNRGKYLLETGNWFAAKSTDDGTTWAYLSPYTLTGAAHFCCWQQVLYEPSRNRMFWELMYWDGLGSPYNQLAIYSSAGTDLSSWCGYLLPPTLFGLPSGTGMYLPKIEYSANFLYLSFDAIDASGNSVNSTVVRFALTPWPSVQR